MAERCEMELCPHWAGDGNVCPCAVFDLPDPARRRDADTLANLLGLTGGVRVSVDEADAWLQEDSPEDET